METELVGVLGRQELARGEAVVEARRRTVRRAGRVAEGTAGGGEIAAGVPE